MLFICASLSSYALWFILELSQVNGVWCGSQLLFCGIPNPRLKIKLHYTLQNNKALIKKGKDRCLNAFLQYHLDSLLPWANAGAEVMGRAESSSLLWVSLTVHTSQLCCYIHYLSVWRSTMHMILSKQLLQRWQYEHVWAAISLSETIPNTVVLR